MSAPTTSKSRASSATRSANPRPQQTSTSGRASVLTAASRLATDTSFVTWAAGVKLDPVIRPVSPNDQGLLQMVERTNQLPRWTSDQDSSNFSLLKHRFQNWVTALCEKVQAEGRPVNTSHDPTFNARRDDDMEEDQLQNDLPQTSGRNVGESDGVIRGGDGSASGENDRSSLILTDDMDPDLPSALSLILGLVKLSDGFIHRVSWTPNEAELRFGVDSLLSYAYDQPGLMTFHLERDLRLPVPDTAIPNVNVQATKPDALILLEFGRLVGYSGAEHEFRSYYSCLFHNPSQFLLYVVHSLVEYKRKDSGKNRALMGLVSGLYQRRALGFENQFVFATIQYEACRLQVVAGIWRNGMIRVYELAKYSLLDPLQMTQFYLLHRAIKDLGETYQAQISSVGRRVNGFPTTRNHDLGSWGTSASSSSAPRTDLMGPVHEGGEDEPQGGGPPGYQGFAKSLKELGEDDEKEKMRRFFEGLQV